MKLLIREYLASLKEREELDAILPDMLSELGFTVISRASIGSRQHGVDMAAVGVDEVGDRKLFLFVIKAGNLTRSNWNGDQNSVRPSLDEIRDSYIRSRVPPEYKDLPIVICLCIGGDVQESVRDNVTGYFENCTNDRIEFQEWNGDKIAGLLLSGVLGETLLSQEARSLLRKSVAMIDEPESSSSYFCRLIDLLITSEEVATERKRMMTALRQLNICLWVVYVWSRDAGNLECPYVASEYAVLRVWGLIAPFLESDSAEAGRMRDVEFSLLALYMRIAESYVERIEPHANKLHGLSMAVRSPDAVDVSLKLFELVGRLSLYGLWTVRLTETRDQSEDTEGLRQHWHRMQKRVVKTLVDVIHNNRILVTPIMDEQAIDIGLVCLFLLFVGQKQFVQGWIGTMIRAAIFTYLTEGPYPSVVADYRELLAHPRRKGDYRERSTRASILFPSLAVWAKVGGAEEAVRELSEFAKKELGHCNMQVWFPGADSESVLYTNAVGSDHGRALGDLEITGDGEEPLKLILEECQKNRAFEGLSAVRCGFWPIVLMAGRHYRLPMPPQFWQNWEED